MQHVPHVLLWLFQSLYSSFGTPVLWEWSGNFCRQWQH